MDPSSSSSNGPHSHHQPSKRRRGQDRTRVEGSLHHNHHGHDLPQASPDGSDTMQPSLLVGSSQASREPMGDLSTRLDATSDVHKAHDDEADHGDFFSSLGKERSKKPREEKVDPDQLKVSSRELNTQFAQGKHIDEYAQQPKTKLAFGAPGYQWRMMKLRKTFEQAKEESRSIEDVALERYGDLTSFQEAKAEKDHLDAQGADGDLRTPRHGRSTPVRHQPAIPASSSRSFMFTDSPNSSFGAGPSSRPVSRQSFRKPGESSAPSTPQPEATAAPILSRLGSFRGQSGTPHQSKPSTPIPSVFTPTPSGLGRIENAVTPAVSASTDPDTGAIKSSQPSQAVQSAVRASQAHDAVSNPPLDAAALNKLEAKVMKAEMTGKSNAQSLRQKLEREKARANTGGDHGGGHFEHTVSVHPVGTAGDATDVQVLPTLDGRGRLYDVGRGRPGEDDHLPPGNRRRKANKVQTHDPATGEFVRYNVDDDEITLEEMVRQEKFKAGSRDQKSYDAELSSRIASDGAFREGFDYLDENVERLARKKMKSDSLKRQFAINDFAKTKKALESCRFCFQEEGERPPLARMVASGTRAYLALSDNEPLVEGHCLIVPIQHHLSMLDADDDTWKEVKNFMKCLLQLAASRDEGFVFFETVVSLKHQRHTVIEAVPLPHDILSSLPGNFRQELMNVESDWSQHHKVIEFTPQRPFRRSLVSQLPYFMVQFDHRGEKGYGHVIEGSEAGDGFQQPQDDGYGISEASMGGGKFDPWFAAQIIGSLLDLEPRAWRKPKRLDHRRGQESLLKFQKEWTPFDWTKMLRTRGADAA